MFSKLRASEVKEKSVEVSQNYSEHSFRKKKKANESYSRIHKNRKNIVIKDFNFKIMRSSNYLYQGQWFEQTKNGEGILMMKNGLMMIATWRKDILHGPALIFPPFGGIVKAQFIAGKINGWMVSLFSNRVITFTRYFEDRIDGEKITYQIDEKIWVASKFTQNGKFLKITHAVKGQIHQLPSFVVSQQVESILQNFIIKKKYTTGFSKISQTQVSSKICHIGMVDIDNTPEGLGVAFSNNEAFIGNFNEGVLNNYGRMRFSNGNIYQGNVHCGQLDGQGIYYEPEDNKTLIMCSFSDRPPQVIEQHQGYVNIDLPFTVGEKLNNNYIGVVGRSIEMICQGTQFTYYQYYLEKRMKDEKEYSIKSQHDGSGKIDLLQDDQSKMFSYSPADSISKKNSMVKWLSKKQQGKSEFEDMDQQPLRQSKSLNKYESKSLKKKQQPQLKKQTTPRKQFQEDKFASVQVKQNFNESEIQKFRLQTPRQNIVKQNILRDEQMSERGQSDDFYKHAFQKQGINSKKIGNKQSSLESESNISFISQKIKGMMRKSSTMRRKIFD